MTYKVPTVVAGTSGQATGDIEITRPVALRVGDLVMLVVSTESSGMVVGSGWTAIAVEVNQGALAFRAWYRFAGNSEPDTYDVAFDSVDDVLYNLFIIRGASPFTVVDATGQDAGNSGLPIAEPGIVSSVDNCLAISCLAVDGAPRVLVVPPGWTQLESRDGAAGSLSHAIAYKTIASAGSSGGADWTATDSSAGDYVTLTLAIRPGVMSRDLSLLYAPQDLLAKTLADCDEFRNLVGVSSHVAAQASIWHESLPQPADGLDAYTLAEMQSYRPFALIFTNDLDGAMATRQASSPAAWADRGTLRILVEFDTPDSIKDSPVLLDQLVKQTVGRMMKRPPDEASSFNGLMDLAHLTTSDYSYLAIDNLAFRGYHRSHLTEQGDYLCAWLEVMYGQRG